MTEEKLVELVIRIDEKTSNAALRWEKTGYEREFQAQLSNSIIRIIEQDSNAPEPDYTLSIMDREGSVIESVKDNELTQIVRTSPIPRPGFVAYRTMERIYKNAKRQALGVDKAIDNILSELG